MLIRLTIQHDHQRRQPSGQDSGQGLNAHGGLGQDEEVNRELAKDAISFATSRQRLFAWLHTLLPFLLMSILGLFHYINRSRQGRKAYVE